MCNNHVRLSCSISLNVEERGFTSSFLLASIAVYTTPLKRMLKYTIQLQTVYTEAIIANIRPFIDLVLLFSCHD